MKKAQALAATAAVFMTLDLLWLGVVARGFYVDQLGSVLRADTNWVAALLFYIVYLCGLQHFVIWPNADRGVGLVMANGAFFGLVGYAACDLTNLAMVNGYPLSLVLVDLPWGVVLTALSSAAGAWAFRSRG